MTETKSNKSSKGWVDYKEVKDRITMEMVLNRYGILSDLKKSGHNLVGCCPIHQGTNPRQFSVNLKRNIFNCFGDCQSGGNVLDFVAKMEKVSLREAALKLVNWFLGGASYKKNGGSKKAPKRERKVGQSGSKSDIVNPPLRFKLKNLKAKHPFFDERGILPDTIEYFGLGFCSRGLMKDRVVIPIHNEQGQLVAYSGRAVCNEQSEQEGKYKLPPNFVKSGVVYNLHRQGENEQTLILVESFLSVFKLYQFGFHNVVALMGSSLSGEQEGLLIGYLGPLGRVILLFDADDGGQMATEISLSRLSSKLFVKAVDIRPLARKPHHLTLDQAKELLT